MSFLHLPEDRPWWFLSVILLIAVGLAITTPRPGRARENYKKMELKNDGKMYP
ncbi:MAG: hypothetical protein WC083_06895 [Candidatus Methanomethylophilaceae archaeon]|jgi:hypothetical protein